MLTKGNWFEATSEVLKLLEQELNYRFLWWFEQVKLGNFVRVSQPPHRSFIEPLQYLFTALVKNNNTGDYHWALLCVPEDTHFIQAITDQTLLALLEFGVDL